MDNVTPDEIRQFRNSIEFLVCGMHRRIEYATGTSLFSLPDAVLAEHNADVWRTWKALDRLALWAGGGHAWRADPADYRRSKVIGACNRLYAQAGDGARVTSVAVTVRAADGTEVSYRTSPDDPQVTAAVHRPGRAARTATAARPATSQTTS